MPWAMVMISTATSSGLAFYDDDRETAEKQFWNREPCMKDCRSAPKVIGRAISVDVMPDNKVGPKVDCDVGASHAFRPISAARPPDRAGQGALQSPWTYGYNVDIKAYSMVFDVKNIYCDAWMVARHASSRALPG